MPISVKNLANIATIDFAEFSHAFLYVIRAETTPSLYHRPAAPQGLAPMGSSLHRRLGRDGL